MSQEAGFVFLREGSKMSKGFTLAPEWIIRQLVLLKVVGSPGLQ